MTHPTERFTSRVERYIKYRPSYPEEIVTALAARAKLTPASQIVDVGSGTGISAALFLRHGYAVTGVEPNAAMRAAAERLLAKESRFSSVAATAEATTLPDQFADLIIAGQAFHWFEQEPTRIEFTRILKPGGYIALIWNARLDSTPFLQAYGTLILNFGTDYSIVRHETVTDAFVRPFFAPQLVLIENWPNAQQFDYAGLEGRLLSSSYTPNEADPRYAPMLHELRRLFDTYQEDGQVTIEYTTVVYSGQLSTAD